MVAFELPIERLQIGLLELLPLIEQAGERLGCDVPCLHLGVGGSLINILYLFFDASEG